MKYDDLDGAILAAIDSGKRKFYIINAAVEKLSAPHAKDGEYFRVVDRRLQALRKSGLIRYAGGEWHKALTNREG